MTGFMLLKRRVNRVFLELRAREFSTREPIRRDYEGKGEKEKEKATFGDVFGVPTADLAALPGLGSPVQVL
jgi:hypothetical protein